ncbi:hypothetical protein PV10_05860 [Exophiala mesophila]|uniref:Translation initiation factor eIF2B subunit beta n=1 Tax=Exophiala mesophila TaxID=212818 RepID=A0A0D1ZBD5_EXOME|nr:uncharacterized protein PV10_05860 [Exophiala mesophila]KIV91309.1 hypothetical protein PV10_05860 [Exophiala mesophila]
MAPSAPSISPGFATFQTHLSTEPLESSIEYLVSLLKRRQIKGSKRCAVATTILLLRTVELTKQADSARLIQRVTEVGLQLIDAAPHEPAVGNIVRRVLGIIRDEDEDDQAASRLNSPGYGSDPASEAVTPLEQPSSRMIPHSGTLSAFAAGTSPSPRVTSARPALTTTLTGGQGLTRPAVTSMFSIISHPTMRFGGIDSPHSNRSGTATPQMTSSGHLSNLRPEVIKGIKEIVDEISAADDEISAAALEQIHPHETILTYSSSLTVQRFLLKAASKRKFTLIHVEAYPNNHNKTHAQIMGNQEISSQDEDNLPNDSFSKPLTSAGIQVILVPDSAIFAVMSRANKVILDAHAVLTNGAIVATAGTKSVIKAAQFHRVPVLVLAATFKLSPVHAYDPYTLMEYTDANKVVPYQDEELRSGLVQGPRNPLFDFVEPGQVDLFVTNQVPAVVSSGYLYRVVRDQYHDEDVDLRQHHHVE